MNETITPRSSWVQSATYDSEHEALSVVTKKGDSLYYVGVPADVWEQVKSAPSMGSALSNLVFGVYPHG